jgi:hypothetical protein
VAPARRATLVLVSEPWQDDARHLLPADLAAELRAARLRVGSLRRCAARAGIAAGYLSRLERGERAPSVSVARDLCDALKLEHNLAERLLAAAVPYVGRDWTPPPIRQWATPQNDQTVGNAGVRPHGSALGIDTTWITPRGAP